MYVLTFPIILVNYVFLDFCLWCLDKTENECACTDTNILHCIPGKLSGKYCPFTATINFFFHVRLTM